MLNKVKYFFIILFVLLALVVGVVFHLFNRAVPKYQGSLLHPLIEHEVDIYTDVEGIPHIMATNKKDLMVAFGYVFARERLFQLEIFRRLGRGTISELVGELGLPMDKLARTMEFHTNFERKLKAGALDKKTLTELQWFLDGVNHFNRFGVKPIEHMLLGIQIEDFTIVDAYSVISLMSFRFAGAYKKEKTFNDVFKKLNDPKYNDLLPALFTNISPVSKQITAAFDFLADFNMEYDGSNAWVVAPKNTKTGGAILASDPHISYSLPGIWFEAHLKVKGKEGFEQYGHYLPLIPFGALGHNKDLGWGLTISYSDDMDFFELVLNKDKTQYFHDGKWKDLRVVDHAIKVRGQGTVSYKTRYSHHGALLNASKVSSEDVYALRWATQLDENDPMATFYYFSKAKNMGQFKQALRLGRSPGLNVIYADKLGNIAWWMFGEFPIRPSSNDGQSIQDGTTSKTEWQGYLSFDERPHLENPKSGIIVSANAKPPVENLNVLGHWQPMNRYNTILEQLKSRRDWDLQSNFALQNLNYDNGLKAMLEKLVGVLQEQFPSLSNVEKSALQVLREWDFKSDVHSSGATIFYTFIYEVFKKATDELGEVAKDLCKRPDHWGFLERLLLENNQAWWDIQGSAQVETLADVVTSAFKQSILKIKQTQGGSVKSWRWGKSHRLKFIHPIGKIDALSFIFNVGPFEAPGAFNVINNLKYNGCDSFNVRSGPSTRRVIDFSAPAESLGILPLGNSGHHLSPYFKNQVNRFLRGQPRRQLIKQEVIEKESKHFKILPMQKGVSK